MIPKLLCSLHKFNIVETGDRNWRIEKRRVNEGKIQDKMRNKIERGEKRNREKKIKLDKYLERERERGIRKKERDLEKYIL